MWLHKGFVKDPGNIFFIVLCHNSKRPIYVDVQYPCVTSTCTSGHKSIKKLAEINNENYTQV